MTVFIENLIHFIYVLLFFSGVWLIASHYLLPVIQRFFQFRKFKRDQAENKGSIEENSVVSHIRLLLGAVLGKNNLLSVPGFFALTAFLFFLSIIILGMRKYGLFFTILFSAFIASSPYAYLRLKLRTMQIAGSYEAENLISEIINQYKINRLNMLEALRNSYHSLKNCPYGKRAVFRLTLALQECRNEEERESAIKEFVFAIGTEWAVLLGMNIQLALANGIDVRASLSDMLDEVKQFKEIHEKEKRENNEAFMLIRFFTPAVYLLSIYAAIAFFGFTPEKFFRYQFIHPMGFRIGLITFSMMIFNVWLLYFFRKPKYDF